MAFSKFAIACYGGSSSSSSSNNNVNKVAKLKSVVDELSQPSNVDFDKVFQLLDMVLKDSMSQKEEEKEEVLHLCSELCGQGAALSDIIQKAAPGGNDQKKQLITELLSKVLEAGGYGHIATTCLSLIAFGLKQHVTSRRNLAQCNELLREIHETLKHMRKSFALTLTPPKLLSPEKESFFKEAAFSIMWKTFTIFKSRDRSSISRCFHAFIDKEELSDLRHQTGNLQKRLLLNNTEDILEHQHKNTTTVSLCGPTHPQIVGVEDKVKKVLDLLAFGEIRNNNEGTRCVCLMGMAGVGKSTLAKCVYAKLVDLRTTMKMRHHMISLPMTNDFVVKEQMGMLKALTQKPMIKNKFYTPEIGESEIANTVRSIPEPVFILLDNLNLSDPSGSSVITTKRVLQMLLPKAYFFPTGSAVLVTTREQVGTDFFLKSMGFEIRRNQVECLDNKASEAVLYKSMSVADADDVPKYIRDTWERPLLKECGGLPLMLEHVGGRIASEGSNNEDVWKRVVKSLEKGKLVDGQLQSSLKSIICDLHEDYLDVFLDIVQCYEGEEWEEVQYKVGQIEMHILWKCFLLRKLPILCEERGYIDIVSIHDAYRGIGRDIITCRARQIRGRGQDDTESRILTRMNECTQGINCNNEDSSVLCMKLEAKYKSSKNLKLVMPQAYQHKMPWTWLKRCCNLIDIEIQVERESSNDHQIPLVGDPCLDHQFCNNLPENLLRLRIVGWEGLRDLIIMQCHELERLSLEECSNIRTVQLSPQTLRSIHHLKLQCCPSLFIFTTTTSLERRNPRLPITIFSSNFAPSLRYLFLQDCNDNVVSNEIISHLSSSLQQLHLSKLKCLQSLHIIATSNFSTITSLKHVFLHDCTNLTSIHLENIMSMESLHVYSCVNLERLELCNISSLRTLCLRREMSKVATERDSSQSLKYMKLSDLPCFRNQLDIWDYHNLEILALNNMTLLQSVDVNNCRNLRSMGVSNLPCLTKLTIYGNPNLEALDWSSMTSLQEFEVSSCHKWKRLALGNITSLRTLKLDDCINLKTVELLSLTSLHYLSLRGCNILELPDISSMNSLQCLTLSGYSKLQILDLGNINNLGLLNLDDCINLKIVELSNLASLDELSLCGCNNLELPDISSMTSLEYLTLSGYSKLQILDLGNIDNLGRLNLDDCINLKNVEFSNLTSLYYLSLHGCNNLELLDISSMTSLQFLTLSGYRKLQILDLGNINTLGRLNLDDCINLKTMELSNLTSLYYLSLCGCNNLELPDISSMTSLQFLTMSGYSKLQILDLGKINKLHYLNLYDCINLKDVELSNLTSLCCLSLRGCNNLELPDISSMAFLEDLSLIGCTRLQMLNLDSLSFLHNLSLDDCTNIKELKIQNSKRLASLSLCRCNNLEELGSMQLLKLEELNLGGCTRLERLDVSNMTSLRRLILNGCSNLESVEEGNGSRSGWEKVELNGCVNLKWQPNFGGGSQ